MCQKSRLEGSCFCGSVKFQIHGEIEKVAFCHCKSCRRISGAVVTVAVMVGAEQLKFTSSEPKYFSSSENARRGFCSTCGTPICWQGEWHGQQHAFVYAGALNNLEHVKPDRHAFTSSKVPWLTVNPDLPQFDLSSPQGVMGCNISGRGC